ncbi:MAG: histidine triad (HIT) family protein [Candidatus Woesearchaeota archaeon]|jgi:histidine triad (HIT) family protein
MDSLFTKIINKEVPANIVYEDPQFIAILDINPITKGHTLLIPKIQVVSLLDLPPPFTAKMLDLSTKIARKLQEKLFCKAFNFEINDGVIAGQEIEHVHMHIIPRYNKKERIVVRKMHNDNLEKVHSIIMN